jgi:hypothetical protein
LDLLGWPSLLLIVGVSWALPAVLMRSSRTTGMLREHSGGFRRWLCIALLGVVLFLLLASNAPNPDGRALLEKIPRDVALYGAHVTHDEMLELYLHSRLYYYMNQLAGWSVADCYRVTSAVSGGVFLILLFLLAESDAGTGKRAMYIGLALAGGYLQLFFGDVENYTLVATLIMAYLLAAYLHLRGRSALWLPSLVLATALVFHLLAGWLLPSLGYLFWRAMRWKRRRECLLAAASLTLPLGATLLFFHFHGLPLERLLDSSHVSGMGGHYERYVAPLDLEYVGGIANVIILLFPGIVLLPVLVRYGRLGVDPTSRFLQWAAFGMLVFMALWRAQLGARQDWNLFAPGMIPVALLVSRSASDLSRHVGKSTMTKRALWALIISASAHSLLWILRNHWPNDLR